MCSEFNSYDWFSIPFDFAKKTNIDESSKKNEARYQFVLVKSFYASIISKILVKSKTT